MTGELIPEFTRRRYGNSTFTWVSFKDENGEYHTPQIDPAQAVVPSKDYMRLAERLVREGRVSK